MILQHIVCGVVSLRIYLVLCALIITVDGFQQNCESSRHMSSMHNYVQILNVETKLSENQTQQSPFLIDIELCKVLDIAEKSLQGCVFDYNSIRNYLRWQGIKISPYNKINFSELYVSSRRVNQVGSIFSRDHICC